MNDLISRKALCDYALNQKDKSVTPNDIMRFPSAQPERKKGKWIFKEDFRIVDGYDWKCDQCGSWQRYTSNYCPKCGARMEGCDD